MKKIITSPFLWLILPVLILFRDFIFLGKIPLPVDTLVGAYYPWLDYKWGYSVGVPVKNALTSDAFSTFYVWKKNTIDLLSHGVIPLWNKYSFSGTPLLATFHTAVLFPGNILLLFPFKIGWGLYLLASLISSTISMYVFLGTILKSKIGRMTGALVYSLAGPMTTWAQFGTAIWAASILPLLLYLIDRLVATNKSRYLFYLSISIMMLIFSGHVQLLTYTGFISPIYFFSLQKKYLKKIDWNLTSKAIIAGIIGLGLGAVQLLPSFNFFGRSIRSEENYASVFNYGLSHWTQLIRLWAADFFGNPVTLNHFSLYSYHEYSSYLGVLTIPLIIYLLFSYKKINRDIKFFIFTLVICIFLAIDNPISHFIFSLPLPLLTYSSASRIFFLVNLSAAVLVGRSVEGLFSNESKINEFRKVLVIFALITICALFLVDSPHQSISLRNSIPYLGLLITTLITTYIFDSKRRILAICIFIIFVFDLGRYYSKYNTFVNPNFAFPNTPVIDFLQKQKSPFRIAKENTNLFPANSWIAYGIESVEGYDPLYSSDYAHFFHKISNHSYFNTVSRYALLEGENKKYLDATNVKFILVRNTSEGSEINPSLEQQLIKDKFKRVFIDKTVSIYENPTVKDRAYFIDKVTYVSDKKSMGQILDNPKFDPTKEVVVLGKPVNFTPSIGSVTSINDKDNFVEITTKSDKEGFLVLADSYDPGWKAYINNSRVDVYQVNGSLRGVVVPRGDHKIVFKYEPESFRNGLIISFISLISLFLLQIGLHLTKKK